MRRRLRREIEVLYGRQTKVAGHGLHVWWLGLGMRRVGRNQGVGCGHGGCGLRQKQSRLSEMSWRGSILYSYLPIRPDLTGRIWCCTVAPVPVTAWNASHGRTRDNWWAREEELEDDWRRTHGQSAADTHPKLDLRDSWARTSGVVTKRKGPERRERNAQLYKSETDLRRSFNLSRRTREIALQLCGSGNGRP